MNFTNIFSTLGALVPFLTAFAAVGGLTLFVLGLYRISQAAQAARYTVKSGVLRIIAGVFLMSIRYTLNLFTESAIGQNAPLDFLAYTPPAGADQSGEIIRLAVIGVRILGYVMVIWGLFLLANADDGHYGVGKVGWHIVGGVFCINIIWVLHAIGYTVGGSMSSTITRLFG